MKRIYLPKNDCYAVVDDRWFEALSQWEWHLSEKGYVVRYDSKRRRRVFMHRVVNGTPIGFDTDHRHGNKLDNREEMLRTGSRSQNHANRNKFSSMGGKRCSSRFKGVTFTRSKHKPWVAQMVIRGKKRHLGSFAAEQEAAMAYNAAAKQKFGEFARLNG